MATSGIVLAKTLFDNIGEAADELSFRKGDIVSVIEKDYGGVSGWWYCQLHGRRGIVPFNYVKELTEEEILHQFPMAGTDGMIQLPSMAQSESANDHTGYDQPRGEGIYQSPPSSQRNSSVDHSGGYAVPPNRSPVNMDDTDSSHVWPNTSPWSMPSTASGTIPHPASDGPMMTVIEGRRILHHVSQVLENCSRRSNSLGGHETAWLDAPVLPKAVEQLGLAGREAHAALHDTIRLSLDVLRVARHLQKSGKLPHLCQQLAQPIKQIKELHQTVQGLLEDLERGTDIASVRQTLLQLRTVLSALQAPVAELTARTLTNANVLFLAEPVPPRAHQGEPSYEAVPGHHSNITTPSAATQPSRLDDSYDGTPLANQAADGYPLTHRSDSCEILTEQPSPQRIDKRPSQLSDQHVRPLPITPPDRDNKQEDRRPTAHQKRPGRSGSAESLGSTASSSRRSSSSSTGSHGQPQPVVAIGQLTESELSLLAYYAEHMDTLIPNVTNAVEAFCRAISDKQAPKQFVWHSKMVVVGAYKMVYVADTVFQKLIHAELRNHVVACSNRLVDCIKSIVASTKNAAQQYPSMSAMRDMVESVSHLPPLALELAESIKEAAHLR